MSLRMTTSDIDSDQQAVSMAIATLYKRRARSPTRAIQGWLSGNRLCLMEADESDQSCQMTKAQNVTGLWENVDSAFG